MKIIDGFKLREVAGEKIICGESVAQIDFNKLISLNESAAFLWQRVEGCDFSVDDLTAHLVAEYGIDNALAKRDAEQIAASWIEAGIVKA